MGSGGYHSGAQPEDESVPVKVGGAGTSGLQDEDKNMAKYPGAADKNELPPDGEQESFTMPPFADGQDVRKTYQRPQGE